MDNSIILGVYRRLDNRTEGLADDSPRALELHNLRKDALHQVFDTDSAIKVANWGDTDDIRPHEFVEIVLGATVTSVFNYALVPGVKWLGKKLAEKAIDATLSEAIKTIFSRLRPKQESKQLLNFILKLPDGTQIAVDPPDRDATLTIHFTDGSIQSLEFHKALNEGAN